MKNVRLKPGVKLILNIILIIIFTVIAFFSTITLYKRMKESKKEFILNYKVTNDLDYKVYINDNPYYQVEYLEKGKQYPGSIISNIKYKAITNYKSSKSNDLKYTYKVIGKMVSEAVNRDEDNEEIWNKEYEIIPETVKNVKDSSFVISEEFDINYKEYETLMEQYKKEFAVSMEAYFLVEYDVTIYDENNEIENHFVSTSSIPLLESTFKINNKIADEVDENIFKDRGLTFANLGLGILCFVCYVIIIFLIIKTCNITIISEYMMRLNKILKMYDDLIIKVDNLPEVGELEVVDLKDFESLVDLEQELRIPIMYAKIDESLNIFAIYTSNFVYRYIFDEEEYIWNEK